jgi:hypothetical protein
MKQNVFFSIVLVLIISFLNKSKAQVTFQKAFGGATQDGGVSNANGPGYGIQQTSDGGYIILTSN